MNPGVLHTDITRLDYMDAVRAFALILGIIFHSGLSFMHVSIGWAVMDISTSPIIGAFTTTSHSFRMELFFLIAGFFGHMTFHKKGAKTFLKSRFVRIVIPFVLFWIIVRPMLVSGWIIGYASMTGEADVWEGLIGGLQSLLSIPDILTGSHLWFLYYLIMITSGILLIRSIIACFPSLKDNLTKLADKAMIVCSKSSAALLVFIIPTAFILWFMKGWGMDTPDRSLIPHVPVTCIYGACFLFGWLLHRNQNLIPSFSKLSTSRWILALISTITCWTLAGIQGDASHPYAEQARMLYCATYAVMMWTLVFLTIGVFRKFFDRPSQKVRYIADASYWMYLIHLPIVVWLQIAVAELPLPWYIKLIGISLATIGICLLTYDLFVRSSFIGKILNGRKKDRVLFRLKSNQLVNKPE